MPMEAVRLNDIEKLEEAVDCLRVSLDPAIGNMGSYSQSQNKEMNRGRKRPDKPDLKKFATADMQIGTVPCLFLDRQMSKQM